MGEYAVLFISDELYRMNEIYFELNFVDSPEVQVDEIILEIIKDAGGAMVQVRSFFKITLILTSWENFISGWFWDSQGKIQAIFRIS